MKAIVIHGYGGPEVLKYEDYPDPVPGVGEVLVRVAASSVNPFDFKIRSGSLKDFFSLTFPAILGLDVSGTVESLGPGVTTFARGDKVFARPGKTGGYTAFASHVSSIPGYQRESVERQFSFKTFVRT
jgi:NADPH:quinone reductase-like Zn-dependent oxidoreductase